MGIKMKKLIITMLAVTMVFAVTACQRGHDKQEDAAVPAPEENAVFWLTQAGKDFLYDMCYYLPEFSGPEDIDEEFWYRFVFASYTGLGGTGVEQVEIEREDLGFTELTVKVSKEEVREYVDLALGIEMPAYEPAFEDMEKGQTSCFYKDGFYYIGVSDFGDIDYSFMEYGSSDNRSITATYRITGGDGEDRGTVCFSLRPADNKNGFVIQGKTIDFR